MLYVNAVLENALETKNYFYVVLNHLHYVQLLFAFTSLNLPHKIVF